MTMFRPSCDQVGGVVWTRSTTHGFLHRGEPEGRFLLQANKRTRNDREETFVRIFYQTQAHGGSEMNNPNLFANTRLSEDVDLGKPRLLTILILLIAAFCLISGSALAKEGDDDVEIDSAKGRFCSQTSDLLFRACRYEMQDDFLIAYAKCINVSAQEERAQCFADAKAASHEGGQLCRAQWAGRCDACKALGEGRYDPDFNPANFDDPKNPTKPNPYFPLRVGNTWEYRGGNEFNTLEVLNETKLIDGVTCIVVRDQVFKDGDLVENTDDWYAQAKDRSTWYCGEEVKDLESFEGDDPRKPELVKIDGSFKAGRDGDKPGIIFVASPKPGDVYLEEFSLGNAEDATEVLSTTYAFGRNSELDRFVPKQLARRLCSSAGGCVVTKNYSLLEPGVFARKYYARGIGFFLEVKPDSGEVLQLTNCNFDSRCANLPTP